MQQNLSVLTPPSLLPVTLPQAKRHLRVVIADDDALITMLIGAARRVVEARLKMTLVSTSYLWSFDYFPNRLLLGPTPSSWLNSTIYPYALQNALIVPNPPLVSVTSIQYFDPTGTLQTMDPGGYVVVPGTPGRIATTPGNSWPSTQSRPGSVQITYTAGFGDPTTVPENIQVAILMLVAHWYIHPEVVSEGSMGEVPWAVDALLDASNFGFYA